MKTYSRSASHASSARADENRSHLRLLAGGAACALAALAALPSMTYHWNHAARLVERLCVHGSGPFAPLPNDAPAREFAGLNSR